MARVSGTDQEIADRIEELHRKRRSGGLTAAESAELEELEQEVKRRIKRREDERLKSESLIRQEAQRKREEQERNRRGGRGR